MLGVGWGGDYAVVGSLMLGFIIGKAVSSKNECDTVNTTLQEQRLERPTLASPMRTRADPRVFSSEGRLRCTTI